MSPSVRAAVFQALEEFGGLLFSEPGLCVYSRWLEQCRAAVSRLLGVDKFFPQGVAIIPNASFGLGIVLNALGLRPGALVITSTHEHFALSSPLRLLSQKGVEVVALDQPTPQAFLDSIRRELERPSVSLIAVSHVSYKDGRIFPIEDICRLAAQFEVPVLVDGTQAVGQVQPILTRFTPLAYVFSAHKWLFGPMGTGAMWVSREFVESFAGAWASPTPEDVIDARRFEGGTVNVALVCGLCKAAEDATNKLEERIASLRALRRRISEVISESLPMLKPLGWAGPHAPGILSYELPAEISAAELVMRLGAKHGVWVKAFKPPETPNAIRISYAPTTSDASLERLIAALKAELDSWQ